MTALKFLSDQDAALIKQGIEKESAEIDKFIYNHPSFSTLYHLSKQRENIISWIPFQKNDIVLEINAECGVITEYLSVKTQLVIAVEKDQRMREINGLRNNKKNVVLKQHIDQEIIDTYMGRVDYILMVGALTEPESVIPELKVAHKLLSNSGKIIIAGYNKMGLKFLSGAENFYTKKSISTLQNAKDAVGFNKKQMVATFRELGYKNIQMHYPYPDHIFVESVYSDRHLPNIGDLHNNIRNFDCDRLQLFDERVVLDMIIDNELFPNMANSFLFVVQKEGQHLNKIYTKFSRERNAAYQIQTSIVEGDEKYVVKESLNKQSRHFKNIFDFYLNLNKAHLKQSGINYCNVKIKENTLIFDYIKGVALTDIIKEHVDNKNMQGIYDAIGVIKRIINSDTKIPFVYTEKFIQIFGQDPKFDLSNMPALENPNIDLIADNIILNEVINVIDYEWIFNFPIPISFILFRSLLHNEAINELPIEKVQEIYSYCEVSQEMFKHYLKMEINFQKYISSDEHKMAEILKRLGMRTVKIEENYLDKTIGKFRILSLDNKGTKKINYEEKLCQNNEIFSEIKIDKDINEYIIEPSNTKCIVELRCLDGVNKEVRIPIEKIESNAEIVRGNTFFFNKTPKFFFKNNLYDKIIVNIYYYYNNDEAIQNIIDLYKEKEDLIKEIDKINSNVIIRLLKKIKIIRW